MTDNPVLSSFLGYGKLLPMKTRHPTTSLLRTYVRTKIREDGSRVHEAMLVVADTAMRITSTRKTAHAAIRAVRVKAGVVR